MTESCRQITTEQYKEYQGLKEQCDHWHKEAERISHEAIGARLEAITLKKKLDIAVKALKAIAQNHPNKNIQEIWILCINNYYSAQKALQEIEKVKQ